MPVTEHEHFATYTRRTSSGLFRAIATVTRMH